jgi:hypothetical protein
MAALAIRCIFLMLDSVWPNLVFSLTFHLGEVLPGVYLPQRAFAVWIMEISCQNILKAEKNTGRWQRIRVFMAAGVSAVIRGFIVTYVRQLACNQL